VRRTRPLAVHYLVVVSVSACIRRFHVMKTPLAN
jgi:hypothetical protein